MGVKTEEAGLISEDGWRVCEGERKGEDVGKDGGKDCSCALESVLYSEFGHQKQDMLRKGQAGKNCCSLTV